MRPHRRIRGGALGERAHQVRRSPRRGKSERTSVAAPDRAVRAHGSKTPDSRTFWTNPRPRSALVVEATSVHSRPSLSARSAGLDRRPQPARDVCLLGRNLLRQDLRLSRGPRRARRRLRIRWARFGDDGLIGLAAPRGEDQEESQAARGRGCPGADEEGERAHPARAVEGCGGLRLTSRGARCLPLCLACDRATRWRSHPADRARWRWRSIGRRACTRGPYRWGCGRHRRRHAGRR